MGLFKRKAKEPEHMLYVGEAIDQGVRHGGIDGNWRMVIDVVGESFYQDNLEDLSQGRTPEGTVTKECLAMIAFEPNNEHDKDAIIVTIADLPVGYIGRLDQKFVAAKIRKVERFKGRGALVRARLTGGWDDGQGSRGMIGVQLAFGDAKVA